MVNLTIIFGLISIAVYFQIRGIILKKEYEETNKDIRNELQLIEANMYKQLSSFIIIITSFVMYEIVRATNPTGYEGIVNILYNVSYLLLVLLVLPILKIVWDIVLIGLRYLNNMMGGR